MKTCKSNPSTLSILILLLVSSAVLGDWSPGDRHKMHSPQLPNPNGWDICLVHQSLADDFQCSQSGPISDIHFWVSWKGDEASFKSVTWQVSICADRAGQPGVTLWTLGPGSATVSSRLYGKGDQGWYCPDSPLAVPHDHIDIYQVNITEIRNPYNQTEGRIYWLVISAQTGSSRAEVGWKTSSSSYFDEVVYQTALGGWTAIGTKTHDLAFVITSRYPVEVDTLSMSLTENQIVTPHGIEQFTVTGPLTQHVFFEGPVEGDAFDDDGDGCEEVKLEIVDLDWTGDGPLLGPVKLREHPVIPSAGLIEEETNNTAGELDVPPFTPVGTADLLLEFYLEIEFAGQILYTDQPSLLSARIAHKPPGSQSYFSMNQYLPLLNADGSMSGCYFALGSRWNRPFWEVDPFDFSQVYLEISKSGGAPETVGLSGFSSMYTLFEGHEEGQADDDDGDGLDEVATEMAALDLSGSGPTLGPANMRLRPGIRSLGGIEEGANNIPGILDLPPFVATCWASSFFDIFFELEINGQVYHNVQPLRWFQFIDHKPPRGAIYQSTEVIPLVHADGSPSPYTIVDSRYAPGYCGDIAHPIPIGDLNKDCLVDFSDFAIFADHWLECARPLCP